MFQFDMEVNDYSEEENKYAWFVYGEMRNDRQIRRNTHTQRLLPRNSHICKKKRIYESKINVNASNAVTTI